MKNFFLSIIPLLAFGSICLANEDFTEEDAKRECKKCSSSQICYNTPELTKNFYAGYSLGESTLKTATIGYRMKGEYLLADINVGYRFFKNKGSKHSLNVPIVSSELNYIINNNSTSPLYTGAGVKFEYYIASNKNVMNEYVIFPFLSVGKEVEMGGSPIFVELNYIPWFFGKNGNAQLHTIEAKAGIGF